jgi:hypothetical protein
MTSASVFRPLVLGVVTGLRSQLGLAVLAWSQPASKQDTRALRLLRSALAGGSPASVPRPSWSPTSCPARRAGSSRRVWPSGCSPGPGSARWR